MSRTATRRSPPRRSPSGKSGDGATGRTRMRDPLTSTVGCAGAVDCASAAGNAMQRATTAIHGLITPCRFVSCLRTSTGTLGSRLLCDGPSTRPMSGETGQRTSGSDGPSRSRELAPPHVLANVPVSPPIVDSTGGADPLAHALRHHVARTYTQPLSCATDVANTPDGCMMMPGNIRLRALAAAASVESVSAVAMMSATS